MQSSLSGLKCNEYTRELILYDSDFKEAEKYREICDTMENALSEYILIMRSLRTECTGVAADNFAAYAELVSNMAEGMIGNIGGRLSSQISRYLSEIDHADDQLY